MRPCQVRKSVVSRVRSNVLDVSIDYLNSTLRPHAGYTAFHNASYIGLSMTLLLQIRKTFGCASCTISVQWWVFCESFSALIWACNSAQSNRNTNLRLKLVIINLVSLQWHNTTLFGFTLTVRTFAWRESKSLYSKVQ